jgi:hypothetical protein
MKHLFRVFGLLVLSLSVHAQNESNSPYSRFGIGELHDFSTATQSAMGGVSIADNDPYSINFNNPASYSTIFKQRFIMQTGGFHTSKLLKTNTQNQVVNSTNFNYLMLAFPVNKFWASSIGLLPYSEMSYSFSDVNVNPSANLFFEGNGGITKFYFGNSVTPVKNLSLGFNINYLFGNLNSSRKVVFTDSDIFNTRNNDDTNIKGFNLDFGLQYKVKLGDWHSVIGITLDDGAEISAKRTTLTETYRLSGELEIVEDTVENLTLNNGVLNLPSAFGMGLSLSNDNWKILADYKNENWADYQLFNESDSLSNSSRMSFGCEFVPDKKAINKYYKMIRYRLGMYSSKTYLNLKNQQLNEIAVSFGLGLPLKRSGTLFNVSAEFGQMGTLDNDLIQESFARFKIGFIFSDVWFVKRKYD